MTTEKNNLQKMHIQILNSESGLLQFSVEPWAEEFTIEPGDLLDLVFVYPFEGSPIPQIVFHKKNLVVFNCYDGIGYFFELKKNNNLLRTSEDYPSLY